MDKTLEQLEDELMTVNIRINCIIEDLSIKKILFERFLKRQSELLNRIKEVKKDKLQ